MGGLGQQPQNLDQVMQMLDNPMFSQMLTNMVDSNPDMFRTMLEQQNPMMRAMFQNDPEGANQFIRQMMNPQALRSMLQMQRAMGGGVGAGGMMPPPSMFGMMPPFPSSSNTNTDNNNTNGGAGLDFSSLLGMAAPTNGGGGITPPPQPLDFGSLMQQFQGMRTTTNQQQQHPADRYRSQLQSLRDMGFDDEQASLAALQQNHGNLNRAVDQLLMAPPPSPAPTSMPATSSSSSSNHQDSLPPPSEPKDAQDKKND